jgi:hypothetical protein
MNVEKLISPFIQSQFPEFYKAEGPNFIAFVKAYFEWMESTANPLYHSRKMYDYFDVDSTDSNFLTYFKNKFLLSLPQGTEVDQATLVKHVLDLYRSKGSPRSYELLFRILFNEDVQIYVPGNDVFKLSDNRYVVPKYVEVTDNQYLSSIIGMRIYDSSGSGSATLDNFYTKSVNNQLINILVLSDLVGSFNYGNLLLCDGLYVDANGDTITQYQYENLPPTSQNAYSLAINSNNAPYIIGSLTAIGVTNGGFGFEKGDLLNVQGGTGLGGVARVTSTKDQNGEVSFDLVSGGFGFSINTIPTVSGGAGTGATFKIGGLTNKQIFHINSDIINDYYNTQLDVSSAGYNLVLTPNTTHGTFNAGDTIISSANVLPLDVTLKVANNLAVGESLTNSALGIANLTVAISDGSLVVARLNTGATYANIAPGVTLISNTTQSQITVNTKFAVQNTTTTATIISTNSTVIVANNLTGNYFFPGSSVVDSNTTANATVSSVVRDTNWAFPSVLIPNIHNLDSSMGQVLTTYDITVGTITYLTAINPGTGYSSNPTVTILEPAIYDLRIPDGSGGYWGYDADVKATAGNQKGVVTSVAIYDSGFGYYPDQNINLISSNSLSQSSVSGTTVVASQGIGVGSFANRSGFLSDTQHLQDSKYYQAYSYDIMASRMLSTYETFVRDIVHPSGIALFGSYVVNSIVATEEPSPSSLVFTQITP